MKPGRDVIQKIQGSDNQAAGRDIHHHQTEVEGGKIDVTISGSNIQIGAVYANLSVQIVIEGRA